MNSLNLPELDFAITDSATVLSGLVNTYKNITNISLSPADPVYNFFTTIAYALTAQRAVITKLAMQTFLSYMTGNYLDNWGANIGCTRLEATKAKTIMQFTLSEAVEEDITIPVNTRVQNSNGLTFSTTDLLTISAGETTGTVEALCETAGEIGNGYTEGQINYLMNPIATVETTVSNITISAGGTDVENDDDYRIRLHNAPASFSVAGSQASYEFWAKTLSTEITDVMAYTPSAGQVNIVVLTKDGALDENSNLYSELESLLVDNEGEIRPMTDLVVIETAEAVDYNIKCTYWVYSTDSIQQNTIQQAVYKAVNDYVEWQRSKLGRGIDPSELIKRMKNAGAKRVEVELPSDYVKLSKKQWANAVNIQIIEGGYTT